METVTCFSLQKQIKKLVMQSFKFQFCNLSYSTFTRVEWFLKFRLDTRHVAPSCFKAPILKACVLMLCFHAAHGLGAFKFLCFFQPNFEFSSHYKRFYHRCILYMYICMYIEYNRLDGKRKEQQLIERIHL